MNFLKSFSSKVIAVLLGAVAVMFLLFKKEESEKEDAQAEAAAANSQAKDSELKGQQAQIQQQENALKTEHEAERAKDLSPEELKAWLEKNV